MRKIYIKVGNEFYKISESKKEYVEMSFRKNRYVGETLGILLISGVIEYHESTYKGIVWKSF